MAQKALAKSSGKFFFEVQVICPLEVWKILSSQELHYFCSFRHVKNKIRVMNEDSFESARNLNRVHTCHFFLQIIICLPIWKFDMINKTTNYQQPISNHLATKTIYNIIFAHEDNTNALTKKQ